MILIYSYKRILRMNLVLSEQNPSLYMDDIIKKSGAFYSYGDIRLGQGRENAKTFLKTNIELTKELELLIRETSIPTANSIEPTTSTAVETE